jgi:hypothetical protein
MTARAPTRSGDGARRDAAEPDDASGAGDKTPPGGKSTGELRDVIDKMRSRVDTTGKLLGSLGTTAVATFGVAKISDLLPAPGWYWLVVVLGIAALLAAFTGVLVVATGLSGVSRPVAMRADLAEMVRAKELRGEEAELVRPVYLWTARLNGAPTLPACEARAISYRRTAEWVADEDERRRRRDRAAALEDEIDLALARGATIVVRDRATKAVTSRRALLAYAAVVLGLTGFTLAADGISAARDHDSDDVAFARACGEAARAGASDVQLRDAGCTPRAAQPGETAKTRPATIGELAPLLLVCEFAAGQRLLEPAVCAPLRASAARLLSAQAAAG